MITIADRQATIDAEHEAAWAKANATQSASDEADTSDVDIGVAYARRCSTASLLHVLSERAGRENDDATAEELAEVERLVESMSADTFAESANSLAGLARLGVTLLPRLVREVAARRVTGRAPTAEVGAAVDRVVAASAALGPVPPGKTADFHRAVMGLLATLASKPVERTPEMVLRAMLGAYEAAALDAAIAWATVAKRDRSTAMGYLTRLERVIAGLRFALGLLCTTSESVLRDWRACLSDWSDYEARLAGTTPLDAPPAEGT